ncbi:hypothetical protein GCM10011416_18500 [Polaribacter pacificus]|uniref:Uncharacterized protein n=1 Tax=Polaribacter pacificus TaxID=1775173 RepID=A0A917MEH2_9FLAO|nr:hypothetical protein GCM10011416_18500 [Polaribacter pacificus]
MYKLNRTRQAKISARINKKPTGRKIKKTEKKYTSKSANTIKIKSMIVFDTDLRVYGFSSFINQSCLKNLVQRL